MVHGTIAVPQYVRRGVEKHDPALTIDWNPVQKRYEVLRLAPEYRKRRTAYSYVTGKRHAGYQIVFPITRDNGTPRSPDGRDIQKVKELDTWSKYERAKDFSFELDEIVRRDRESAEREDEDRRYETFVKPAYHAAVGREQIGFGSKTGR